MTRLRLGLRQLLVSLCLLIALPASAQTIKVGVFDDAPPLAYRDDKGTLTGFTVAIAEALCAELKLRCELQVVRLETIIDDLAAGQIVDQHDIRRAQQTGRLER